MIKATGSSANTLDPVNHGTPITISNGNLTATTNGANYGLARSLISESSGKYCIEVTATTVSAVNDQIGIINASEALTGVYLGEDANGLGYFETGPVAINGVTIGTAAAFTMGSVIDQCVDFGAQLYWARVNGGNWNNSGSANPATGAGGFSTASLNAGPYYVAVGFEFVASDTITANFTSSPTYAYPSGFTNWGGTGPPTPAYSFLNAYDAEYGTVSTTATFAITLTGSAGRLIIATYGQSLSISSIVYDPSGVNQTLTQDYAAGIGNSYFYSANIPAFTGAKNVVVTFTSGVDFNIVSFSSWLATNLTTGFIAGAGANASNVNITVTSGEFLFAIEANNGTATTGQTFSGSTSAPTGTRYSTPQVDLSSATSVTADWAAPTTGTFNILPGAATGGSYLFAATYK
jgi:hypothetical protein